jgi:hypothetical protein
MQSSHLKQLQIPTEVEAMCPTTAPTEYQSFHTKLSLLSEVVHARKKFLIVVIFTISCYILLHHIAHLAWVLTWTAG